MKPWTHLAAAAALALAGLATTPAHAATVVVDVAGARSTNLLGEAGNTVWLVDIGAGSVLTSLNWNVTLSAFAPSSLSEMQVSFGNSSGLELFTIAPGALDSVSGTGSYAGFLDLSPFGISAGADGVLRLEFSESFKDFALGQAEGEWIGGSLRFDVSPVPEPASAALALLGLAALTMRMRRRS